MSELKPCPFCGADPIDLMGYDYHKVTCSNDECMTSSATFTKEKWNKRSYDDTITEQEKVISELVDKIQLNTEILTAIMERNPLQGSDYHAINCTIKNNKLLTAKHKQSKGE